MKAFLQFAVIIATIAASLYVLYPSQPACCPVSEPCKPCHCEPTREVKIVIEVRGNIAVTGSIPVEGNVNVSGNVPVHVTVEPKTESKPVPKTPSCAR